MLIAESRLSSSISPAFYVFTLTCHSHKKYHEIFITAHNNARRYGRFFELLKLRFDFTSRVQGIDKANSLT